MRETTIRPSTEQREAFDYEQVVAFSEAAHLRQSYCRRRDERGRLERSARLPVLSLRRARITDEFRAFGGLTAERHSPS